MGGKTTLEHFTVYSNVVYMLAISWSCFLYYHVSLDLMSGWQDLASSSRPAFRIDLCCAPHPL
jgi:hypothetical protein